jgi:hypothetical protein
VSFSAVVYDAETRCCMPGSGDWARGLEHCKGWTDYQGAGISVVAAYDYLEDSYMVFMADNLHKFQNLVDGREHVIGFNSLRFDDPLLAAHDVAVTTTYDLLKEIREAVKSMPKVETTGRRSYNLELLSQVNLGGGKHGDGAMAPMLWQCGRLGSLISYCLRDVQVTKQLFDRRLGLIDPNCGRTLQLRDLAVASGAEAPL